jgi:undecaprenyl-diphosphatase
VPILHAIVLGITQGFSEFLPISSSGHLLLVPWLFGWDDFAGQPDLERTFDVALHLGTLVGAVAYFRSDLLALLRAALRSLRPARVGSRPGARGGTGPEATGAGADPQARLAWLLLASAVPAAAIGAAFESSFTSIAQAEWAIGLLLIAFGLVLAWADSLGGARPAEGFGARDALIMGLAQAVALAPGVSRSGVTITSGRSLGFSRDGAARLAFLMSMPITFGALVYQGADLVRDPSLLDGFEWAFVAGVITSGLTGWLAVWGTLRFVRTHTFRPFVIYRVVLGLGVILVAASAWR